MKPRRRIIALMLTLVLTMSFVSAQAASNPAQELAPTIEGQAFGGMGCGARWGVAIALSAATLSGCAMLCGVAAWYSLIMLNDC